MSANSGRYPRRRAFAWLPVAFAAACSGGGGTAPVTPVPTFEVLSVSPPNGATGVGRRTEVRVQFSEPVSSVGPGHLLVEDAAGPLPGLLDGDLDGRLWRWRPVRDLPYGSAIRVRLGASLTAVSGSVPAQLEVGTFHVIDHGTPSAALIGAASTGPIHALAWANRQAAVIDATTVHDLGADPPIAHPLPIVGGTMGAVRDGAGGFTAFAVAGFSPYTIEVAQGTLSGGLLASTLAPATSSFGRGELVGNDGGDAAVYVYGLRATEAVEGLWFGRAGSGAWTPVALAEAGSYPLRRIALDGLGNVFVGFIDGNTGRLRLQRHDRVSGADDVFDVAGSPAAFLLGAMGNGDARILWHESNGAEHSILSRRLRGGALGAPLEVHRGEATFDVSFAMAQGGAAVHVAQTDDRRWVLQRLESDDAIGTRDVVAEGLAAQTSVDSFDLAIAPRGEAWFVWIAPEPAGDVLYGVRSRPGRAAESPRALYRVSSSTLRIHRVAVDVEDGGRVVVAFTEDHTGPARLLKAIVLQ